MSQTTDVTYLVHTCREPCNIPEVYYDLITKQTVAYAAPEKMLRCDWQNFILKFVKLFS